ncbi:hypothetical protein D3C85_1503950 [compost metagenome]
MMTNTISNPPPYITFFASKYLNGVMYFRLSSLSFRSIAIDITNVSKRIPVASDADDLDFVLTAATAVPMNINRSCKINMPAMVMVISPITDSPLLYFPTIITEAINVTRLNTVILTKAASNFEVMM